MREMPQLRDFVDTIWKRDYLWKEYTTVEQRIYAIKTDKRWQWLGKLYPVVFTKDRQVLLLKDVSSV